MAEDVGSRSGGVPVLPSQTAVRIGNPLIRCVSNRAGVRGGTGGMNGWMRMNALKAGKGWKSIVRPTAFAFWAAACYCTVRSCVRAASLTAAADGARRIFLAYGHTPESTRRESLNGALLGAGRWTTGRGQSSSPIKPPGGRKPMGLARSEAKQTTQHTHTPTTRIVDTQTQTHQ